MISWVAIGHMATLLCVLGKRNFLAPGCILTICVSQIDIQCSGRAINVYLIVTAKHLHAEIQKNYRAQHGALMMNFNWRPIMSLNVLKSINVRKKQAEPVRS
jgi:hypothetical protein